MSIGLLIIAHDDIGDALLTSATNILGFCSLHTEVLAVRPYESLDAVKAHAAELLNHLSNEEGVLVLTDLLGSTPSNVAGALQQKGKTHVVAGLNLPMLIKVLSHPNVSLQQMTELALEGGKQGIMPGRAQTVYPLPLSSAATK